MQDKRIPGTIGRTLLIAKKICPCYPNLMKLKDGLKRISLVFYHQLTMCKLSWVRPRYQKLAFVDKILLLNYSYLRIKIELDRIQGGGEKEYEYKTSNFD